MKLKVFVYLLSIPLVWLGLVSCKVTTEPIVSSHRLPDTYQSGDEDTLSIGAQPWKIFYKDTLLTTLIERSLQNNPDVKIALDRVTVSRADYRMVKKNFLPAASAQVTSTHKKFGKHTMDGVGNDDTNKSENITSDQRIPDPYQEWFAGAVFSWEADIWGKLSNQRKAGLARYLASQEARHGVLTWLVSEVATGYYELIGLDQEKKVLEENIRLQEFGLELISIQKAGGKVNQLAVDQFEAQVLNTRSQLIHVEQEIRITEARINRLLGRYPQALRRDSIASYNVMDSASTGRPLQLVANRPDIRQAELELAAAHADVNAARAAFYPSLSLSAAAGFAAFDLSKWFLMPGSAIYNLAGSISAPVFQRGQIRALYSAANAQQRIALSSYEKALLTSYHEVYATQTTLTNLGKQIELKNQEAEVLRRAFNNSNDLFSVGYATYLEVITAQRRMLEVELELTRLKKEKLKVFAVLYRALGGGWR